MKTLFLILGLSFLLIGCKKDENEREPNTYTIEGHYLQNCSTAWEHVNLRFYIERLKFTSREKILVAEGKTDVNGFYTVDYQDPKEFKSDREAVILIEYSTNNFPTDFYPIEVGRVEVHKNLTVDYVTQPNDTAFFRTIGGGNLTSNDTLYFEHETQRLQYVVGPIDDNSSFDTIVYKSNFGRQTITWSIGINNVNTMRERNKNYGNYGSTVYQRNICSSEEILIDLSNAK